MALAAYGAPAMEPGNCYFVKVNLSFRRPWVVLEFQLRGARKSLPEALPGLSLWHCPASSLADVPNRPGPR